MSPSMIRLEICLISQRHHDHDHPRARKLHPSSVLSSKVRPDFRIEACRLQQIKTVFDFVERQRSEKLKKSVAHRQLAPESKAYGALWMMRSKVERQRSAANCRLDTVCGLFIDSHVDPSRFTNTDRPTSQSTKSKRRKRESTFAKQTQ